MTRKWIFILFFSFCTYLWADQQQLVTKVIQLHYQSAQNVVQLMQPMLNGDEQISGTGQTLMVKVTPNTLTQLRVLLHKLDQPPATLEVSVYQGDQNWLANQQQGNLVISTQSQQQQQRYQSVQVMNGQSAVINTGQERAVISNAGWWTGVQYQPQMLQSGVRVEPILQGQRVKLSIQRIRQQPTQINDQSFNQQDTMTTIVVPLNQWVKVGSAQGSLPDSSQTMTIRAGNQFTDNSTLYVRVKIINGETNTSSVE